MRPIFLKGKRIFLSPLFDKQDLKSYASWLNDQETTTFMGSGRFPVSEKDLKNYAASYRRNKNGMLLGIFLNKSKKHIGNIALHMIDWRNSNAEIGIIIGDKKSRGKGLATEAIRLIVEHSFNRLNLHKLYAGMAEGNEASRRAFQKVGFKVEATLREHFYLNNRYLDCCRMGIIKNKIK